MSIALKVKKETDVTIEDATYLQLARSVHKTHKNKRMSIPKGSFLYDLYSDLNPNIKVKKATQCGISEYLICRTIKRASIGRSVLYVMPTFLLKNQFVQERVNKTIMFTPAYNIFQRNYGGLFVAESMSIKQFGTGSIVYTGSNTPTAFVSYPADDIVIDELDECSQDYLSMAEERQSASIDKTTIKVGNPTFTGFGIDYEYNNSDQKFWTFKHDCGEWIVPDFWKHIIFEDDEGHFIIRDKNYKAGMKRDIYPICDKCKKPYDRFSPGEWARTIQHDVSGYHISKMFSTAVTVKELIARFDDGLKNEYAKQRFYNGDLGLAFTSSGAKIDISLLNSCVGDYREQDTSVKPTIAGIDVGTVYNIIISEVDNPLKVLLIKEVRDTEEVLDILIKMNVKCFVIDAMPETREARKIISIARNKNKAYGCACYFSTSRIDFHVDPRRGTVGANRTYSLDAVKECIFMKNTSLPFNAMSIPGFSSQMTASTRVFDEDKQRYDWVHGSEPDHYFLAFCYMLLAKRIISEAGVK